MNVYEVGIDLESDYEGGAGWLRVSSDDGGVHLHVGMSAVGLGNGTTYAKLSRDQAVELAGALERAVWAFDALEVRVP